jgi:CubicO group peptidase (beta-lactamase class C family)
MRNLLSSLWIAAGCLLSAHASRAGTCPEEIRGGWETQLPAKALFGITIEINVDADGTYQARLLTSGTDEDLAVWHDRHSLRMQSERLGFSFEGRPSGTGNTIDGFVAYSSSLYRVTLDADGANRWSGAWSPLPSVADSVALDLYFDDDGTGGTGGYFFFRDDRLPGLHGLRARCSGGAVELGEKNLGLTFRGAFDHDFSRLTMTVAAPGGIAQLVFTPMSAERRAMSPGASDIAARSTAEAAYSGAAPRDAGDGWPVAAPPDKAVDSGPLGDLVDAVSRGDLPRTHSVVLAKSGFLVFEEYFYGFGPDITHDMRSASKSLASTLIGLAVDRELIGGPEDKALSFFPEYRSYRNWDPRKADISIQNLMTMSSGLDANDSERSSVAAESAYQSQSAQADWVRLALDAPMIADPGTRLIYGGANPLILGGILRNVVSEPVEWFAEMALFRPLGIDRYNIFMDPTGVPYLGGGMYLRPRDMLKIGQMYLDDGTWLGRQILSASWVAKSFGKYGRLEPLDRNGNEYGYLWWHENYTVGDSSINSIEARGNGGQYIFVLPELNAVAVITSGNYRAGLEMTRQPQRILQAYLLPALLRRSR